MMVDYTRYRRFITWQAKNTKKTKFGLTMNRNNFGLSHAKLSSYTPMYICTRHVQQPHIEKDGRHLKYIRERIRQGRRTISC